MSLHELETIKDVVRPEPTVKLEYALQAIIDGRPIGFDTYLNEGVLTFDNRIIDLMGAIDPDFECCLNDMRVYLVGDAPGIALPLGRTAFAVMPFLLWSEGHSPREVAAASAVVDRCLRYRVPVYCTTRP